MLLILAFQPIVAVNVINSIRKVVGLVVHCDKMRQNVTNVICNLGI